MSNYSYNEIKKEFRDYWEDWMPNDLLPFQAPPGDNVSNADSKIYTKSDYKKILSYFERERVFNPFCDRMSCWNVNLKHVHDVSETKDEYVAKIVELLEEWEQVARGENKLNQSELQQLTRFIKLWKKKNPIGVQEAAYRNYYYDNAIFKGWERKKEERCWSIAEKLKEKIDDGKITDDTDQPDDPIGLCSECLQRFQAAQKWEKNYRQAIKNNCQRGNHYPISHVQETKIHAKCWKKNYQNDYNDIQPCGCLNIKSSDLLESTSENLVKSFFVLDKVKSIKKKGESSGYPDYYSLLIRIEYLNGRVQEIWTNEQVEEKYKELGTYLKPLPTGKVVTRKDLNIEEQDNPDDEPNLEEVRKQILSYFRAHGIESVRLKDNKLVIKYNFKEEEEEKELDSRELLQIHYFCQTKGVNFLTLSDLEERNNTQKPRDLTLLFYAGTAFLVALMIGLIAYFVYQSSRNSHRR